MPWIQIKIDVKAAQADAVADAFTQCGAQAVTLVDAKDTPMYEPKPGEVLLWPDTTVIGLYESDIDPESVIQQMCTQPDVPSPLNWRADPLEDKDWERAWMDNFHAMQFGQRLWICPSWREIPNPQAVNVMLDPGLAFGTGTHPTTAMCLRWLDGESMSGKTFVDFGCGSGILAVAALKLGAAAGIGIDIDPQALQASMENAKRNQVEDKLNVYLPDHQPSLEADFVFANILSGPLLALRNQITAFCRPGGRLVLSGILNEQREEIESAYSQDFILDPGASEGEWACVAGTRRK